jgi:3-oxoacyl-[acyl-carrier-protein] synthase-1
MEKTRREVVITGCGACCLLGDDLPDIEQSLRSGQATPFHTWPPAVEAGCGCQLIGVYEGDLSDEALGIGRKQGRFMGRAARLALRAARVALARSGPQRSDLAVVVGSGTGDVATHIEIGHRLGKPHGGKHVPPTVIPRLMSSTVSANLVNVLRTTGPSLTVAAACAAGAYNLLVAAELIANGHTEAALCGGVEVADLHFHVGFDVLRAYNRRDNDRPDRASRPYAADRCGFIFGEGAGIVVLETREAARARGAEILGVLHGYGMSSDGSGQMVAPEADGALAAMEGALTRAGLRPEEIDYVNTHATSTPLGDLSEVRALRRLFDGRRVPYSSTKGYTGHTVSAAGALEAIFTLAMLRDGWVAPSVNANPVDPELLDYPPVVEPTDRPLRYALSNSFGFGGTNVSLVLGAT